MVNLFSLTTAMEKGYTVTGTKSGISLSKSNLNMNFDTKIGTPKGHIFGAIIKPQDTSEIAQITESIEYQDAHQLLGHPGRNKLLGTAERLNWKINPRQQTECEDCMCP